MGIAVFSTGILGGMAICWLLDWLAELIARRANRMQPVVLPPDAASDLNLGRSADRDLFAEVMTFIENRIDWLENMPEGYESDEEQLIALKTVVNYADALDLGPESSESQDAMEKA